MLNLILYSIAAVCFVLAAFGVAFGPSTRRISVGWFGLLAWVLVPLIAAID